MDNFSPDLKLYLLEATAATSLSALHSLAQVDKSFHALYLKYQSSLLESALQTHIGRHLYKGAVAVAIILDILRPESPTRDPNYEDVISLATVNDIVEMLNTDGLEIELWQAQDAVHIHNVVKKNSRKPKRVYMKTILDLTQLSGSYSEKDENEILHLVGRMLGVSQESVTDLLENHRHYLNVNRVWPIRMFFTFRPWSFSCEHKNLHELVPGFVSDRFFARCAFEKNDEVRERICKSVGGYCDCQWDSEAEVWRKPRMATFSRVIKEDGSSTFVKDPTPPLPDSRYGSDAEYGW